MAKKSIFTKDTRSRVLALRAEGKTVRKISEITGINKSSIGRLVAPVAPVERVRGDG